ncbi:MAG: adenosylmethionine decarboxylase [Pseudomonadota bacterium]|jgi:S-adenosylmethionine decarboxylase proenzyme
MNAALSNGPGASRGSHWVMDFCDCRCEPHLLSLAQALQGPCLAACRHAGMQVVGERFHQFMPEGVTGAVLLAESHLAIHTWPESRFVALDVYVCDFSSNNRHKGMALVEAMTGLLRPAHPHVHELSRGSVRIGRQVSAPLQQGPSMVDVCRTVGLHQAIHPVRDLCP